MHPRTLTGLRGTSRAVARPQDSRELDSSTPIRWNFASITIRSSLNESVCTPLQDADIASGRSEVTTVSSKRVTVRWSIRLTESP